jgi:hypothetical protein
MVVLDLKTLGNQLVQDQLSRGRPGVSIDVPYRTDQFGKLEPFTVEREQAALDQMAAEIPRTLVKLAVAGQERSLNRLAITAERSKRSIFWHQDAETVRCRTKGVIGLRRYVRLADYTDGRRAPPSRFSDIEFRRRLAIPPEHAAIEFPSYFRPQRGHCHVSVSVSLRRDRIDLTQPGRFYYPLASSVGYTGKKTAEMG